MANFAKPLAKAFRTASIVKCTLTLYHLHKLMSQFGSNHSREIYSNHFEGINPCCVIDQFYPTQWSFIRVHLFISSGDISSVSSLWSVTNFHWDDKLEFFYLGSMESQAMEGHCAERNIALTTRIAYNLCFLLFIIVHSVLSCHHDVVETVKTLW